jgi:hypothetical protein
MVDRVERSGNWAQSDVVDVLQSKTKKTKTKGSNKGVTNKGVR